MNAEASPSEFARMVGELLVQYCPTASYRYDESHFRYFSDDAGFLELRHLYKIFQDTTASKRNGWLDQTLRAMLDSQQSDTSLSYALRQLLPIVRSAAALSTARIAVAGLDASADVPTRELLPGLVVGVVVDSEDTMRTVTSDELASWGVGLDTAIDIAVANLRAKTDPVFAQVSPGLWRSRYLDSYDASRILLAEHVRAVKVTGEPIVMLPSRDCLLIAGSGDVPAMRAMLDLGIQEWQSGRSLSLNWYGFDDAALQIIEPTNDSLRRQLQQAKLQSVANDYLQQQKALETWTQEHLPTAFIATFSLQQFGDEVRSYCVWTAGLQSWLPQTDLVALASANGGNPLALVRWEDLQALAADALAVVPASPPRYRVVRQLTDAEIRHLCAKSIVPAPPTRAATGRVASPPVRDILTRVRRAASGVPAVLLRWITGALVLLGHFTLAVGLFVTFLQLLDSSSDPVAMGGVIQWIFASFCFYLAGFGLPRLLRLRRS